MVVGHGSFEMKHSMCAFRRYNDQPHYPSRTEKARNLHRFKEEERMKAQKWERERMEREKAELDGDLRWNDVHET